MQFQSINTDALSRVLTAIHGEEATAAIGAVYKITADAMQAAFNMGRTVGTEEAQAMAQLDAEARIEERLDNTFDNGFAEGKAQAEDGDYNEGYMDGVRDARATPSLADNNVQSIINEGAAEYFDNQLDFDFD
jgi:hypothetical protein